MFTSLIRRTRNSTKSLFTVAMMVLIAATFTTGAGLASTETHPQPPSTSVDNPLSVFCDRAVATFNYEIAWITNFMDQNPDFDPNDPRLVRHYDAMWAAWEFAEFTCGIDVGGDGEIG